MEQENRTDKLYRQASTEGIMKTIIANFGVGARIQLPLAEIYKAEIEKLDLSVRGYNCLKRTGINTIEQLVDAINNDKLTIIRNLGVKSIGEIRAKILEFGYENLSEQNKRAFISNLVDINQE